MIEQKYKRKKTVNERADATGDSGEVIGKKAYPDDVFLGIKTGVVKNFGVYGNRPDFGFILDSKNNEYFCHYGDIVSTGFKNLAKGQHVKFKAYEGKKGLVAREIQVIATGGDPYAEGTGNI